MIYVLDVLDIAKLKLNLSKFTYGTTNLLRLIYVFDHILID